jgi:hypothetical protein
MDILQWRTDPPAWVQKGASEVMAMMSQSLPVGGLSCPAGVCRRAPPARPRISWRAVAAGFVAGAAMLALTAVVAERNQAQTARKLATDQQAAAAHWEAPRELPREWRYQVKGVDTSGMFRKRR